MTKIKGGYILQPRVIQHSDIAIAPPYVREIWGYLLREANHKDKKSNGFLIKRGQLFRTYQEIREGLKWYIGWRKMTYNENQTKKAMKFLRETQRIDTKKELGGVLITIIKYDFYQDPDNYDRTTKNTNDRTIEEPLKNHPLPDNNKNEKNEKNEKNVNNSNTNFSKKNSSPQYDFIDKIINTFCEVHGDYEVLNIGKERKMAGKLLNLYKKKYPNAKSDETLEALKLYFKKVMTIDDIWIINNMSLSLIVSKFNEINKQIKNGKSKQKGVSQEFRKELYDFFKSEENDGSGY